jgi:hypothetical protein
MWTVGNLGVGCRASDVVALDLDRRVGVDGAAVFAAACAACRQGWPGTFTEIEPVLKGLEQRPWG